MNNQDLTKNIALKDILYSLAVSQDNELKERVLLLLKDSSILEKVEEDLIKEFETLCIEVEGIPTPGTLVSRNVGTYTNAQTISSESLEDFTRIFIGTKKKQGLTTELLNITNKLNAKEIDFDSMTDEVRKSLNKFAPNELKELESNIDESYYEKLTKEDKKEKGVKLGVECIDSRYNGLGPGEVVTIAGYAGSMKTTTAANWCYNAVQEGKNVLYMSFEISKEKMTYNLLSRHSGASTQRYTRDQVEKLAKENPEEFMKLANDFLNLDGKFRVVDENDIPGYSASAFNNLIDRVDKEMIEKTGKKLDIIVVDHLQLLKFAEGLKMNDPYQIGNYFVSYFREKAARDGYCVIMVSQTSRNGFEYATKHNGLYLLTGLAESNELERASTFIITTYMSSGMSASSEIQMAVLKNRNGERMQETETAPISPEYYMVGTGIALEAEMVAPIYVNETVEKVTEGDTLNLDELLSSNLGGVL